MIKLACITMVSFSTGASPPVSDPCATTNGGCHADADCLNTDGEAICTCKDGFGGDGQTSCLPTGNTTPYYPCSRYLLATKIVHYLLYSVSCDIVYRRDR